MFIHNVSSYSFCKNGVTLTSALLLLTSLNPVWCWSSLYSHRTIITAQVGHVLAGPIFFVACVQNSIKTTTKNAQLCLFAHALLCALPSCMVATK